MLFEIFNKRFKQEQALQTCYPEELMHACAPPALARPRGEPVIPRGVHARKGGEHVIPGDDHVMTCKTRCTCGCQHSHQPPCI